MSDSTREHAELALPFGIFGALGVPFPDLLILAPTTGLFALVLGWVLTRPPPAQLLRATGLTIAAGAANGFCLGLLLPVLGGLVGGAVEGALVLLAGAAFGGIASLLFLPVFLPMLHLARRVGRVSTGSVVDASDRRAVWTFLAVAVAVWSPLVTWPWVIARLYAAEDPNTPAEVVHSTLRCALPVGALVVAVVLVVWEAVAWHRLRELERAMRGPSFRPGVLPARAVGVPTLDVGPGDPDRWVEEVATEGTAYRDADPPLRVIRGDAPAALALIEKALRWRLLGVVVSTVAAVAACVRA